MKLIAPSFKVASVYVALTLLTVMVSFLAVREYEAIQQESAQPWLTYLGSPWKVKNTPRAGEAVLFDVTRCNSSGRGRSYELSHFLVRVSTGERTVLPPGLVPILPGCHTGPSAANVVPVGTEPDHYFVEGYAEVDNGYRPVTVHWASQPFEVIP